MDSVHVRPLDYISVIRRRRWYWIAPLAASAVVGLLLARFLPREYRASTTLGVTAALVSPNIVNQGTLFGDQERLRAISQQLLSTPILARVVRDEGLASSSAQVDEKVSQLRQAITISVPDPVASTNQPRPLDMFVVAYTDSQPARAQRVANRLATTFVAASSKARTAQAEDTSTFIDAQLAASQKRMTALEARLRQAKEAHMGVLPDQMQANLQMLGGLRQQIATNTTALRGERDRLSLLDRQVGVFQQNDVDDETGRASDGPVSPAARVTSLEHELAAARTTYTEKYPEVQRLEGELAAARHDAQALRQAPPADRLARLERNPAYQALVGERDLERAKITDLQRSNAETERLIQVYQSRMEAAPMVEEELATIQRDYDQEKQQYADLSNKQRAAAIAASVERDRSGEQFAVLESASLPTAPIKPIPMRVLLVSLLAGLCLGAALTLGREYFDSSVHDERELRDEFELPVLGSIRHISA